MGRAVDIDNEALTLRERVLQVVRLLPTKRPPRVPYALEYKRTRISNED
jgi:hypothetical protein